MWFARYSANLRRARNAVYSADKRDVLERVREKGYAVVEGYWSRTRCNEAIEEMNACMREHPAAIHRRTDERVFGLERISAAAKSFHDDPFLLGMADEYVGYSNAVAFTMGNRIQPSAEGALGSGGDWHRDGFLPELKTMLYLSDVAAENGPFGYYERSHRARAIVADMRTLGLPFQADRVHRAVDGFSAEDERARKRLLTGAAGTLLVFDTRGIHTGAPIREGTRYALTNYIGAREKVPSRQDLQHFAPIVIDGPQVLLESGEILPLIR